MLQKRILAAVLSLVMAIAMITPVTAAAPSEVEPAFWHTCNTNRSTVVTNSVQYESATLHRVDADMVFYCTTCGKETDRQKYIYSIAHSYGSEVLSISHSGGFDIYTYTKTCSGCRHSYVTRTEKKICTGDCQIPLL